MFNECTMFNSNTVEDIPQFLRDNRAGDPSASSG